MHLNQFLQENSKFLYVPVIFSLLLTIYTCYLYTRNEKGRTLSNLFAVIASLVELLSSIVLMKLGPRDFNTGPILYTFSNCSVYLIIWSSFHLLLLVKNREGPKSVNFYMLYFGYGWMAFTVFAGILSTIILNHHGYFNSPQDIWDDTIPDALFRISNWVFVVTIWLALYMLYRDLSKNARITMIIFSALITISAYYFTFEMIIDRSQGPIEALTYLFGNLPVYLAIAIGANLCSFIWVKSDSQDVELGRVTTPSSRVDDTDSQMTLTEDKNVKREE